MLIPFTEIGIGIVALCVGFSIGLGLRKPTQDAIGDFVEDIIAVQIERFQRQVEENPKMLQPFIRPLMQSVMQEFSQGGQGGPMGPTPKAINFMGIKIPPEIYMPFAQAMMMKMLPQGANQAPTAALGALQP